MRDGDRLSRSMGMGNGNGVVGTISNTYSVPKDHKAKVGDEVKEEREKKLRSAKTLGDLYLPPA